MLVYWLGHWWWRSLALPLELHLHENVPHVVLHGLEFDLECDRYLFVAEPALSQSQNLLFARGQAY